MRSGLIEMQLSEHKQRGGADRSRKRATGQMLRAVNACEKSLCILGRKRSGLYGLTLPLPVSAALKQSRAQARATEMWCLGPPRSLPQPLRKGGVERLLSFNTQRLDGLTPSAAPPLP